MGSSEHNSKNLKHSTTNSTTNSTINSTINYEFYSKLLANDRIAFRFRIIIGYYFELHKKESSEEMKEIGICPICERIMIKDLFVDRHHFLPKCRGGKDSEYVHKICHNKIHSIWTEKELEQEYHDPEKVRNHPEMQKFIKWVSKKDPGFYNKNEQHTRKR